MPRRNNHAGGGGGTKQKGLRNRYRTGRSTYSKKRKGARAERYDRPYLEGTYRKEEL